MGLVHHTNVVTDGIKFYWDAANRRSSPGTGSDGTAWTDLIKGKIGTLDNNATFTTHKGGYVEFDGTDDSVEILNDADFTMPAGDWTICLWCADLGGNTDKRHIIGTYATNPRWIIRDTDDSAAGWAFMTKSDSAGWNRTYSTVDIQDTDDEWHYLVVTGSSGGGSGSIKLYTDGVDTSLSSSYALESITRATTTITMGLTATNGHDFMGYIASVAIYNRVLTAAEVLQNYEATRSRFAPRITKSGLVGNWDAGDPNSYSGGTTWKDTANGNDGTLTNWVDGDFTNDNIGHLGFDGSDGYCAVPGAAVDFRDKMSLFTWVNFNATAGSGDAFIGKLNSSGAQYALEYASGAFKAALNLSGSWTGFTTSFSLSVGTWCYVGFTYDRVNVKTYGNAVLQTTTAETDAISGGSLDLIIGGGGWNGAVARSVNVEIALVKLYNRDLTAAEIMDNYNKTKARFGH